MVRFTPSLNPPAPAAITVARICVTPAGHVQLPPVDEIVVLETVWDALTVYVPVEPNEPVNCAVIFVPAVTPVPVMTESTVRRPPATAVTVSVVPEMEPVELKPVKRRFWRFVLLTVGAVLAHADPVLVRTLPAVPGAVLMTVPVVLGSVSVELLAAAPASRVTEPPPEPLIDTGIR